MLSIILKIFPIVDMENEIDYSECARNAPKFSYIHQVFFDSSLNMKYLCKYFFGNFCLFEIIIQYIFIIIKLELKAVISHF